MNIVETIREETSALRAKTAIVEGDKTITYGDLLDRAGDLAGKLRAQSIAPGMRIGFHCRDGIDYVCGALALLECGASVVPIADSLTPAEARETIERIDVQGTLAHIAMSNANIETASEIIDDVFRLYPRNAGADFNERCQAIGAAFIRFSSGTTGQSKGVVLSHRSIIDRTDAANRGLCICERDVILWVLAMSHHFVVSILLFLRKGATIIVANQFFPFSVLDAARRFPITFIYGSPVHYHLLGEADAVAADALKGVRLAISTAMKMPPDVSARFAKKFGFAPAEAYGIIEVGLPFINTDPSSGRNTVGRALPDYALRVAGPDEHGIGEVFIRGKGMFDAYFSPWRLREECTTDGWFDTGDVGRLDDQGRLWLLGRSKTVLVCAGMKVFPEEVEAVINTMPGVRQSLVSGREHPQFGQVPIAQMLLLDNASEPDQIIQSLRAFCCERLSSYKVPVEFVLVHSLPMTASGKLARATSGINRSATP